MNLTLRRFRLHPEYVGIGCWEGLMVLDSNH